jgi:GntR family transcriptional regulator
MPEPRWRQIADDIRKKIMSGELRPMAQLPTELQLREEYGASRNTVRDAIRQLTYEQLVETRAGLGTFVLQQMERFRITLSPDPETGFGGGEGGAFVSEVTAQGRRPETSDPRVEMQQAKPEVARALRIQDNAQVVSRHQQRYIDGEPYSLQTSFYPMELVTKKDGATRLLQAENIEGGTVDYLKNHGIEQVGYRDRITVRGPDENEKRFFGLRDGVAIVETYRVAYGKDGAPFRLTVSVFPADRNEFVINVGKVPADPPDEGGAR